LTVKNLSVALIAAAVLAGCSTLPASDSLLAQARNDYSNAQANPQVTSLAAGELKEASDSLDKANNASSKGERSALVDHLAYVAKQKVAIAQETARQKAAELAVASASAERDRVRLDARTREADSAQRSAEAARRSAEAAQRQSEASQRSAEAAQRQAAAERQAANEAELTAQAARQQALDAESRSRQLEAQLKDMEAKKTDRGLVITLGDVLFDTNQAQLKSGAMRNLQKLADFVKQYPQRKIMIEGFTDSTGSGSRNQELSDKRAYSVRTALLDMGIGADRIASRGYGESYPVAGNDTAAGRQLNRRVEIIISDDSGNIATR
jgi:outer membrane protein OmpA-like peptidoglycan-associated protein